METTELMIDNLVSCDKEMVKIVTIQKFTDTVFTHTLDEETMSEVPLSALQGIPLTPEILEKCGADRIDHMSFAISINNGWKIIWETNNYIYLKYLDTECEVSHVEIKCLHQLQNLYFALTGSHLQIKL